MNTPPPGRRLYILSDAGKPIWASTNEPEHALSPLAGVVTAVLGFAASGGAGDALKCVVAGSTSAVVIVRGAVVLLAVSPYGETEAFLALLLEALYHQILFTLTSLVQKKLRASAGYDVRDLLGGTEPVLAGLAQQGPADAGLLASAVRSGSGSGSGCHFACAGREWGGRETKHICYNAVGSYRRYSAAGCF